MNVYTTMESPVGELLLIGRPSPGGVTLTSVSMAGQRFAPEILTNPSGFSGVDGIFRFRADGTNQRGLAVLRVTPAGPQVISPAPRAFSAGT